ncbi:MAG TPA: ABC transporter permease, partial [Stellaceae bacterium]
MNRWRDAIHDKRVAIGGGVLVFLVIAAFGAPPIAAVIGLDPDMVDLYHRLAAPSLLHPFGTDEIGRDLLFRLLEGGRVSLLVGIVAALVAAIFGTAMGLVAGYRGGRLDAALMRFTDGVIALPLLPLLVVLAALDLKKLGIPSAIVDSP